MSRETSYNSSIKCIRYAFYILSIALILLSIFGCSPEETEEELRQDCNCIKYYYTVTFQVNSSGTGFVPVHTLTEQEEVCEEPSTSVYYDDLKYYNVLCD